MLRHGFSIGFKSRKDILTKYKKIRYCRHKILNTLTVTDGKLKIQTILEKIYTYNTKIKDKYKIEFLHISLATV